MACDENINRDACHGMRIAEDLKSTRQRTQGSSSQTYEDFQSIQIDSIRDFLHSANYAVFFCHLIFVDTSEGVIFNIGFITSNRKGKIVDDFN